MSSVSCLPFRYPDLPCPPSHLLPHYPPFTLFTPAIFPPGQAAYFLPTCLTFLFFSTCYPLFCFSPLNKVTLQHPPASLLFGSSNQSLKLNVRFSLRLFLFSSVLNVCFKSHFLCLSLSSFYDVLHYSFFFSWFVLTGLKPTYSWSVFLLQPVDVWCCYHLQMTTSFKYI